MYKTIANFTTEGYSETNHCLPNINLSPFPYKRTPILYQIEKCPAKNSIFYPPLPLDVAMGLSFS